MTIFGSSGITSPEIAKNLGPGIFWNRQTFMHTHICISYLKDNFDNITDIPTFMNVI